ncbi:MAG: adenine phosphoribosyltransferase [Francisellaceae bacterium]|jgi:adenine phosphoribosyltransferase|nr:adenine phosphoribosyltransferase [Francisellaceae bacterium]MBT6538754.1 adenine phosphoribosyltransferase [Francisellaceae bacterium]
MKNNNWIKSFLNVHPDFPITNVSFITFERILADPNIFNDVIEGFATILNKRNITAIAAIDSRGFLFGAPLALKLRKKLCLIRKPGKTPDALCSEKKQMEYSSVSLEMQNGSLSSSDNVLIVDDIIATGATLELAIDLIKKQSAQVDSITALLDLTYVEKTSDLSKYLILPLLNLKSLDEIS